MRTLLPLATLVLLAGPAACGPSPTPASPAGAQGEVKVGPSQAAASPAFDLSPVAEPAAVVGVLRWGNPAATLSSLAACGGLSPTVADASAQAIASTLLSELVSSSIDTNQLAGVLALDAPVHLLVALDESAKQAKPMAAVSFGLSSLERARGALEAGATLTEVKPGMWKIGGKEPSSSSCFLAASAGSAPARLLCGDRDRDVTALGPYLARTLPTLSPEERDLHGEVRFVPISAKYGEMAKRDLRGLPILAQSQLAIGQPQFDRALTDAATAVQGELAALIDDAGKAFIDVRVDSQSCMNLTAGLELRGQSSWLAGTMADEARRAGPAPALYWRAPKDSYSAFFDQGGDPARYGDILKTLRAMLEGWLEKEKIGRPADRKALADVLSLPVNQPAASVSAHGDIPPAPAAAKTGQAAPNELLDGLLGGFIGWNLYGVDAAPDGLIKYLKNAVVAYNTPGLRTRLPDVDIDPKQLPTVKTVPAPKDLGKNALAVEIQIKDIPKLDDGAAAGSTPPANKAKPKPTTVTLHLLLMGEEKTTWIAFGHDRRELLRRLTMVKAGAPDAETLASRPGLEPLKSGKFVYGGFTTLAPITRGIQNVLTTLSGPGAGSGLLPPEARQFGDALAKLPHKGEGLMLVTAQDQGGAAPRPAISINLSKPVLEDIGALLVAGLQMAGITKP
ncbi:hypothetical protein SOCE26_104850 [Sorangium cellulosum]|uniref:Secreted protein n=1 Tax=Sorangium cellulosum TaxID=56 RepID=A0A2L0FBH4_SORCE|nr:hypothetical protein [Sorangium cellulosum]AUX48940.1 hypothetical protein SOCE26_104850 [Sorangium cellulosum]